MGGPQQKGVVQYSAFLVRYIRQGADRELVAHVSLLTAMSPFRQRAFKGVFSGYVFNGYARAMKQAPYMVIPFAIGYAVYSWSSSKYAYYNSKEVRV